MVSFYCDRCGDTVKKPKVQTHAQNCGTKNYCCIDCMTNFDLASVKDHTNCVSEVEKYQGNWLAKGGIAGNKRPREASKIERVKRPPLSFTDSSDEESDKKSIPDDQEVFLKCEISLGTVRLLKDLIDDICNEQDNPSPKMIGQELVIRYKKRLGKIMTESIKDLLKI